jgi:hypothetical protein
MNEAPFFRTLGSCVATALLVVLPGCSSNSPGPDTPDPELPIEMQRTSIAKTIEYLVLAWRHGLYPQYENVLHDQFEFIPLEEDAADFPWMTGSSWSKTEELGIAQHMFDPNFSAENPPIHAIEIDLTEISRREIAPNHIEVNCTQQGRVLTAANDGWSFDTRVLIEIVPDPEEPGLFQVIKQTEVPFTSPSPSVEETSWGSIKSLYR